MNYAKLSVSLHNEIKTTHAFEGFLMLKNNSLANNKKHKATGASNLLLLGCLQQFGNDKMS